MLRIRLSRFGKKKKPIYRIIVSERARDPWGKALEYLGHYNPHTKVCEVKKDRILYWLSQGAQPSPTVHNLLVDQNVIRADKVRASKGKKKKKEKKKEGEPVAKLGDEKKEAKEEPKEETKVEKKEGVKEEAKEEKGSPEVKADAEEKRQEEKSEEKI